ncbi:MAG: AMP-binding protein [Anaerolineaceae bacterium]|nr:AMP-binding protein [Anaerolineaceae bacterium]
MKSDIPSPIHEYRNIIQLYSARVLWKTCDGYTISYNQFGKLISSLSEHVNRVSLSSKSVCYVSSENHPDTIALLLGLSLFVKCVPINPGTTTHELHQVSKNLQPDIFFTHPSQGDIAAITSYCDENNIPMVRFSAEIDHFLFGDEPTHLDKSKNNAVILDETPGWVFHTSGSSGLPKAIFLTHENVFTNAIAMRDKLQITEKDINLHTLPIFHVGGIIQSLMTSFVSGCTSIFWSPFSSIPFQEVIAVFKPTWFTSSPAIHKMILRQASSNMIGSKSFRFVRTSSAFLDQKSIKEMLSFYNVPIISAYGATEAAGQITLKQINKIESDDQTSTENNVGHPVSMEIDILDDDLLSISNPNIPGKVAYRGNQVAKYAFDLENANKITNAENWYISEDVGYWNVLNELILLGRSIEIINRGGELISAKEIENILISHSQVSDCVVLPILDDVFGDDICAFIVSDVQLQIHDVVAFLQNYLSDHKIPSRFYFLEQLPLLPNFKIDIEKLFEYTKNTSKLSIQNKEEIQNTLQIVWCELFDTDEIDDPSVSIFQSAADSMMIMQLALHLSEALQIRVLPSDIFNHSTFTTLLNFLYSKISQENH